LRIHQEIKAQTEESFSYLNLMIDGSQTEE
jgi:hypothetical protein